MAILSNRMAILSNRRSFETWFFQFPYVVFPKERNQHADQRVLSFDALFAQEIYWLSIERKYGQFPQEGKREFVLTLSRPRI